VVETLTVKQVSAALRSQCKPFSSNRSLVHLPLDLAALLDAKPVIYEFSFRYE
jgi:hypothetical protein